MQLRTGRTRSRRMASRTNSGSSDSSIEDLRDIRLLPSLSPNTHGPKAMGIHSHAPRPRRGRATNAHTAASVTSIFSRLHRHHYEDDSDTRHLEADNGFCGSNSSMGGGGLSKESIHQHSNASDSGISNNSGWNRLRSPIRSDDFSTPLPVKWTRVSSSSGTDNAGIDSDECRSSSSSSSPSAPSQEYNYPASSSSTPSDGESSKEMPSINAVTHSRKKESPSCRRRRWLKTADILKKSGLLDITIKTAELLRKNQIIQKEIESLQKETNKFVLSVLGNIENKHILESIQSQAQLYEFIVPGSQTLMMRRNGGSFCTDSSSSLLSSLENISGPVGGNES